MFLFEARSDERCRDEGRRLIRYMQNVVCPDQMQRNDGVFPIGFETGRQRDLVVCASDSQSGGPGFESPSGDLLDLLSVVPSSNPRPHL